MISHLLTQVREFCSASIRLHSYNIPRNSYTWFGFLWGLQVPLIALLLYFLLGSHSGSVTGIWQSLSVPVKLFFFSYPLLFSAIFGILGTIRKEKNEQIKGLIRELKLISITDPLTKLYNRRHLTTSFQNYLARMERTSFPLSLLFLDIDFFKQINDNEGHHIGDKVLQEFAHILQQNCRPYDIACRWGGEEFVLLLPEVTEKDAASIAERIRKQVENNLEQQFQFTVTISVGVSQYNSEESLERFIDKGDQALYEAKESGRNKTVCWSTVRSG